MEQWPSTAHLWIFVSFAKRILGATTVEACCYFAMESFSSEFTLTEATTMPKQLLKNYFW